MRHRARFTIAALAFAVSPPLRAQTWTPPRPPCDVEAGHFRVTSAIVNLRTAAEKPTQRDRMLRQTQDVLNRALTQDNQTNNPGAWYYLGRYYVEMGDAAGADSAFDRAEALVPQCAADIKTYREQLWVTVLNDGLRNWREGREDSAVVLLSRAAGLLPANPRPHFSLGKLYANRDAVDSATLWLRRGMQLAATDTAFARDRQDAMSTLGRLYVRRAQTSPVFQQWQRTRYSRDSLERGIANDSVVMGRMVASSASRRARGARLSPADQQAFAADSTARAQSLARGRAARAPLAQRLTQDSAALAAEFAPAIETYREYLAADPGALDAAVSLAALYGQSGRPADAAAVFDQVLQNTAALSADQLFEAGRRLTGANLTAAAARAYSLGLEKSPHNRDALLELANAYVQLQDQARALPAAQRLMAVDPLNRVAIRLVARSWQLRNTPDSTLKYLTLADSSLTVDLVVTSFLAEAEGAALTALANNLGAPRSAPFRLVFEFLDAAGAVQASHTAAIPAMAGGTSHELTVRVAGRGILAWRYRLG